ncbi:MAG: FG-GAP repeat domain-containing protein [Candidatus Bipolaricaulia bacterium]
MSLRLGFAVVVACAAAVSAAAAEDLAFAPLGPGYGPAVTFQIVLGDVDDDGDLDAVFANQGSTPSRVGLNDGCGIYTFTDQNLATQGHGAALGDLDGDGDLDLVIACASLGGPGRPSRVYMNDGHGEFEDTGQSLGDASLSGNLVELVDIENDGDLDIFIVYLTIPGRAFVSRVFANDGLGTFSLTEREFPFGTRFCDLDGDGDADAFAKESGVGYRAWIHDGNGGYHAAWESAEPSVWYEPSSFAFGDLNGDGIVDILDTNGSWTKPGSAYVLFGNGAGGFDRHPLDIDPMLAAWPVLGDFDRDGDLDAALACVGEPDRVLVGDGAGTLTDSGLRLGGNLMTAGLAVGDLDADGDLDLFIPVYGMTGGLAVVWRNVTAAP